MAQSAWRGGTDTGTLLLGSPLHGEPFGSFGSLSSPIGRAPERRSLAEPSDLGSPPRTPSASGTPHALERGGDGSSSDDGGSSWGRYAAAPVAAADVQAAAGHGSAGSHGSGGTYHGRVAGGDGEAAEAGRAAALRPHEVFLHAAGDAPGEHGGSLFSGYVNMVTATVGVGVLSFPYAFYRSGIVSGVLLTVLFSVVQFVSALVLVRFADRNRGRLRHNTFEELVEVTLGKPLYYITVLVVLLSIFGTLVGFVAVIMDSTHPPLAEWAPDVADGLLRSRWLLLTLITVFVIFPLSLMPNMHHLWFSSVFAILSIFFVALVVLYRSFADMLSDRVSANLGWVGLASPTVEDCAHCRYLFELSPMMILAMPLQIFALGAQLQVLPVYLGIRERQKPRFWVVLLASILTCASLYILIGLIGYLGEGQGVEGNILLNFPISSSTSVINILTGIAQFSMAVHVTLAYPVQLMPGRMALDMLFDLVIVRYVLRRPMPPRGWTALHFFESVFLIFLASLVAYFVPVVQVAFGFVGASALPYFVFSVPAVLLLVRGTSVGERILGVAFVILSAVIIPMSVGVQAYSVL